MAKNAKGGPTPPPNNPVSPNITGAPKPTEQAPPPATQAAPEPFHPSAVAGVQEPAASTLPPATPPATPPAMVPAIPETPVSPPSSTTPTPGPTVPASVPQSSVEASGKRTVWIYVNRHEFPIHLPHPNDPGSSVTFPPCPDKKQALGMLDFKLHPFFANFVGFKRSVSQEPAPDYLQLDEGHVQRETGGADSTIHDLMRMSPDRIADYVRFVAQSNPEIASQIAQALPGGNQKMISQAPPGL